MIAPSIKKIIHNKFYTHPHTVKNHNKLLWHLLLFENVDERKPPWPKPASQVDLVRSNVYHAFQRNPSTLRLLFGENGYNRTHLSYLNSLKKIRTFISKLSCFLFSQSSMKSQRFKAHKSLVKPICKNQTCRI